MPYCDNCGNRVSITDKRCSKCGNKLDSIPPIVEPNETILTRIKRFFSPEPYHNIEFILALIGVLLSVLAIPNSFNSYSYAYSNLFY